MRTFAGRQHQPQNSKSFGLVRRPRVMPGAAQREHPLLHLQRTTGNQAVLHLMQTSAPGAMQTKLAISQLGDIYETEADRLSEQVMSAPEPEVEQQPSLNPERFQTRHGRGKNSDARKAQPALKEAGRTAGQPLDAETRAFMEPRFGHDFSGVRVHDDARAAQSSDAVNAHAYTVGNDIVFGPGEYAPGTTQGKSLIAHELAHVVQKRNSINSPPVLQRAAKTAKTSAGEFVADPYDETVRIGAGGIIVGYGADITITFKPNERVDAEQIAFVQTAVGVKDDKVSQGTHIDQDPNSRMPLYGMESKEGDDLANPTSMKLKSVSLTKIGFHHKDASKKLQQREAVMYDEPFLSTGDNYTEAAGVMNKEWYQRFETTALAIAGNQKGTFYGSVEWGWVKRVADLMPTLLEFKTKSETVPSPSFMDAAKAWNASVMADKKSLIDLPIDVHITSDSAQLWDSPDQRKEIAILTKDTPLGRVAKVDPKGRIWWTNVIVTDGKHAGKTGWVMEVHLH